MRKGQSCLLGEARIQCHQLSPQKPNVDGAQPRREVQVTASSCRPWGPWAGVTQDLLGQGKPDSKSCISTCPGSP